MKQLISQVTNILLNPKIRRHDTQTYRDIDSIRIYEFSCDFIDLRRAFVCAVAYLLGLPILGYSLDIGKENVNLINEKLEKLIYSGQLDAKELDR